MLNLSYVKRWVITDNLREISVAEHSYRVAVIAMALIETYRSIIFATETIAAAGTHPYINSDWVIRSCLCHDVEEAYTGDVPGPDKDKTKPWPDPRTMDKGAIVVKLADIIETWTWGIMYVRNPMTRPSAFDPTATGRDVRKVMHYTQHWPEMRVAVRETIKGLFGGLTMEGL